MDRKLSTREQLKRVAPNLFRHAGTATYYGIKRVAGRERVKSLDTHDRRTANGRLAEWIATLERTDTEAEDLTLDALIDRFMAGRLGKSASTRATEQSIAKRFRETFRPGTEVLATRVRNADLVVWLDKEAPRLRASSVNRYRLFLHQLFAFAKTNRFVAVNPFSEAPIPARPKQRVIRRVPTDEEFTKLIAEIRTPSWSSVKGKRGGQRPRHQHATADFCEFLGLAGVGQAEAAALQWEDIDWEANRVHYTRVKTQRPFWHPIYAWLRPLLERLRTPGASGRVFQIHDGRHALTTACQRAKLPHFTQRNLRARLIGHLWKAGVDVKLIALWQGHHDGGRLIMDTYTEVFGSSDAAYMQAQLAKAEGSLIRSQAA